MDPDASDIRWLQRFANFKKAEAQLAESLSKSPLNMLEEQGLIKCFEYNFELGWNLLKDYLSYQGVQGITGSRDAIRAAFKAGLLSDGEGWMEALQDRNRSAHTYDESAAKDIVAAIRDRYAKLFAGLRDRFSALERSSKDL
jgi:nucleotidyltransferase substrate binding protein (TIGR01987 family)